VKSTSLVGSRPGLLPAPRAAFWILLAFTLVTCLSFWYRYLDVLVRAGGEPFQIKLIEEATGVYGALVLLVFVVWFSRYLHRRQATWSSQVLFHLPVLVGFALLHSSFLWGSRSILFPLVGLGRYDYGAMPLRYFMELGIQVPAYLLAVGVGLAIEQVQATQERELRLARVEGELARAQVANLEHRLRPHFLFNALNTVSSVMYDDRDRADRILADLSLLLRRSLAVADAQEVPLKHELENLELFMAVVRARFEDRLSVELNVDQEALDALVPVLLLQPLVENALRHGHPGPDRPLRVRVQASVGEVGLEIEVSDDGPGAQGSLEELAKKGIGLDTTLRRLELLYPGRYRAFREYVSEGGFRIRLSLPHRRLDGSEAAPTPDELAQYGMSSSQALEPLP
jgi:two-component system, LytTR family, sensor kinase